MKAVILAAGYGTRFLPVTKTIPKEMLPVGDKPVIQHTVESLVYAGIKDIIIITSQYKKILEDYFDKNYELEHILRQKGKLDLLELIEKPKNLANLAFVKQTNMLGTGHAILQARPWISDDFFMVLNGDDLYSPEALKNFVDLHNEKKKSVMLLTEVEDTTKWGVAKIENGFITDIVEKPSLENSPSNLINTGGIIYPRKIFDLLEFSKPDEKSGEIYPWDAFKQIMAQDGVLPCVTSGWKSIGSLEFRIEANVKFMKEGILF